MTMKEVDQTHPYTNDTFGVSFFGPAPVTDGGRKQTEEQKMEDVDHEPPTEGARRTFQRGVDDENGNE